MDDGFKTTRRSALAAAGAAFALSGARAAAQDAQAAAPLARPRFLIDCHVHVGAAPRVLPLAAQMHSTRDWVIYRSTNPDHFAEIVSEPQIDNSDSLVQTMDAHGVSHAIIQTVPGRDASNQRVIDITRRHPGRFYAVYRPELQMDELGSGTLSQPLTQRELTRNARRIAEEIGRLTADRAMIGVGEMIPGGLVTSEIDPIKITRDLSPVMETLRRDRLPIQFATGSSAWRGGLTYLFQPIWVDEVAGNFPEVPIILTKMGRGIDASFDSCLVVAMRNANVFLDMTDSRPEHIREAIQRVGARRIMFGTDLSGISVNYAYEVGFDIIGRSGLSAEDWEWIAWRTTNAVYRLGLDE